MPITFSEEFEIPKAKIEKSGVFDVILDVDARVFIDPALLEKCTVPEFDNAKQKIETYFSNIIMLLKHTRSNGDMFWKKADHMLSFREISGTCFGYSQKGTGGNAIGRVLRKNILNTIKDLLKEGEADPALFELLGVFQENVGCDRISDLITFVLQEEILQYTHRIVAELEIVSTSEVIFNKKIYSLCINPYNCQPLLLLPEMILSALPIAESFDDIDFVSAENQRVRDEANAYINLGGRTQLRKDEILSLLQNSIGFRKEYISAYKSIPKEPYDFSVDPEGEYIWCAAAKEYAKSFPLDLSKEPLSDCEDVLAIALKICEQFKQLIENNGLHALLYDNGKPKKESAAQLLFFGIADSYCTANNIDLTKEGNNGRGPVDFKLSRGAQDKIVVETKLTSNHQLKHGIEKQLPIYMKQERTQKAIYLIIDTGHAEALNNFIKFYNDLDVSYKEKIKYIVIDATPKKSASIA